MQGSGALELLKNKVKQGGVGVLYSGAAANFAANWVGNYPWFATFNYLQANVPKMDGTAGLARNAAIGATASIVSDCVSNSLRVVKTVKQTNADASLGTGRRETNHSPRMASRVCSGEVYKREC